MKPIVKNILVCLILLNIVSCTDDFLTLVPQDVLTDANFFRTEADAQSALIGAYGTLQPEDAFANVKDAAFVEWGMSGDMYPMDGNALMLEMASLTLPATAGIVIQLYQGAYLGIARANYVISRVGQMDDLDEQVKTLIIGQAKFLRGVFFYRLANYYGGVPLIVEELSASSNLEIPRATTEETWKQVETDMKDAAAVLPDAWENAADIGRATRLSALAFLAKVYLWQERWAEAVTTSEQIISADQNDLLPDYRDVFLETNENNKEILFSTQFRPGTEGEGNNLAIRSAPRGAPSEFTGSGAWSNFVPELQWINAFETDINGVIKDKRYWETIIGPGEPHQDMPTFSMPADVPSGWSITGYIVTKYWQKATVGGSGVNPPIVRFAEVLLNYAEALNEVERSDDAMMQVNLIRARAGLDAKPLDLTKAEVLDAIFYERRMEFIWESGGGFSDLNRRGRFIDFITANRPNIDALNIDSKPWLHTTPIRLPIPTNAWSRNKALVQNPGYAPF